MKYFLTLLPFLLLVSCSNDSNNNPTILPVKLTQVPVIEFSNGNHSDSTLYIDTLGFNNTYSMRAPRFRECGFALNFYDSGGKYYDLPPPTSIQAVWEHELTNTYYKVSVPLHKELPKWLLDPSTLPTQRNMQPTDRPDMYPSINIIFRDNFRVDVWLVIYGDQLSDKTAIKLGEAVGYKFDPKYKMHVSGNNYKNKAGKIDKNFRPGQVLKYDRGYDQDLTRIERYGCFSDKNDLYIEEKEPYRNALLIGLNGELINCSRPFCEDKIYIYNNWRNQIRKGTLKLGDYNEKNPSPLRIHPKPSDVVFKKYLIDSKENRKKRLARKEKVWICLNPPEPCFRGILKDYPVKNNNDSKV